MREQVIENAVCEWAEQNGWLVRKCVYAGRRGSPDRWFMRGGKLVLLEFKAPGRFADAQQQREHLRLKNAGFPVIIITSVEDGIASLSKN